MGIRVLIADDEPAIRLVVSTHMQRRGWQVDEATDGGQAVALASDGDYDVLVLDQRMPQLTGLEVVQSLSAPVPAVLYSAYLDPDVVDRARALGCQTVDKTRVEHLLSVVESLAGEAA